MSEGLRLRRELAARTRALGATRVLYMAIGGIALHEQLPEEFARPEWRARARQDCAGDAARANALLRYVGDHPRATFQTCSAAAVEHDAHGGELVVAFGDGVIVVASRVIAALVVPAG